MYQNEKADCLLFCALRCGIIEYQDPKEQNLTALAGTPQWGKDHPLIFLAYSRLAWNGTPIADAAPVLPSGDKGEEILA